MSYFFTNILLLHVLPQEYLTSKCLTAFFIYLISLLLPSFYVCFFGGLRTVSLHSFSSLPPYTPFPSPLFLPSPPLFLFSRYRGNKNFLSSLFVFLSVFLSVGQSVFISDPSSFFLSVCLSVCTNACLSVFLYLFVCPIVGFPLVLLSSLSVYLSFCQYH